MHAECITLFDEFMSKVVFREPNGYPRKRRDKGRLRHIGRHVHRVVDPAELGEAADIRDYHDAALRFASDVLQRLSEKSMHSYGFVAAERRWFRRRHTLASPVAG